MRYNDLYQFVISELENKLAENLSYHNVDHTKKVIESVVYLAEKEGISENDLMLLKTAALLHDVGFINGYLNHEVLGCEYAKKILPEYQYSTLEIEEICKG